MNLGTIKIAVLDGVIAGYLTESSWTSAQYIEADKLNIFNSLRGHK